MSFERRCTHTFKVLLKSSSMVEDQETGKEFPTGHTLKDSFLGFLEKKSENKMLADDKNKFFSTHALITYYDKIDKKTDVIEDENGARYEIVNSKNPLSRVFVHDVKLVEE
jgi:hypothetical protein